MLRPGKYRHHKGDLYEVIGEAVETETREKMAVYRSLYDSPGFPAGSIWVRPLAMFMENVEVEGETKPRFEYLSD